MSRGLIPLDPHAAPQIPPISLRRHASRPAGLREAASLANPPPTPSPPHPIAPSPHCSDSLTSFTPLTSSPSRPAAKTTVAEAERSIALLKRLSGSVECLGFITRHLLASAANILDFYERCTEAHLHTCFSSLLHHLLKVRTGDCQVQAGAKGYKSVRDIGPYS
ncbi:hypothetical protein E2C01_051381 [Portunus trituberculatus]|uniref:Uncharacterized protein n=1 Tax=Portunus trituberculatus TaxID=210409 RepID=A0A5B7GEK7_PORTR|nr:hypothetical protein [Portunus trituberculatus]